MQLILCQLIFVFISLPAPPPHHTPYMKGTRNLLLSLVFWNITRMYLEVFKKLVLFGRQWALSIWKLMYLNNEKVFSVVYLIIFSLSFSFFFIFWNSKYLHVDSNNLLIFYPYFIFPLPIYLGIFFYSFISSFGNVSFCSLMINLEEFLFALWMFHIEIFMYIFLFHEYDVFS